MKKENIWDTEKHGVCLAKKKVIENMIDLHPKNVIKELNPALVKTLNKVTLD